LPWVEKTPRIVREISHKPSLGKMSANAFIQQAHLRQVIPGENTEDDNCGIDCTHHINYIAGDQNYLAQLHNTPAIGIFYPLSYTNRTVAGHHT